MKRDLSEPHKRRFKRLVRELNRLREDVERDGFDANWYLDDDTLNLMDGPSHSETGQVPLRENVLIGARVVRAGGGGW